MFGLDVIDLALVRILYIIFSISSGAGPDFAKCPAIANASTLCVIMSTTLMDKEKNDKILKTCDECGSQYYFPTSDLASLCPECAHILYGYQNCQHKFKNGRCIKCFWDGSRSEHVKGLISKHLLKKSYDIETVQGTFTIQGSFELPGRGLVIYGDIVDGVINKQNFLSFRHEGQELKLKINDINFLDRISGNVSKVGLTFYYESDEQKKWLGTLQIMNQTAKIVSD